MRSLLTEEALILILTPTGSARLKSASLVIRGLLRQKGPHCFIPLGYPRSLDNYSLSDLASILLFCSVLLLFVFFTNVPLNNYNSMLL